MNKKTLSILGLIFVGLTIILISIFSSKGGVDNGGVDNGGVDNGGVDNGGVDNGGVDNGGVDDKGPASNCDGDCKKWLDAHNKYRDYDHQLTWDVDLAEQSKQYASKLNGNIEFQHGDMVNKNCTGSHKQGGRKCGQNLEKAPSPVPAGYAVDRWYAECKDYKKSPFTAKQFKEAGEVFHYTQVVWKGSKKVGCGMVGNVSACLYDNGNILGTFDDNAPPGQCNVKHHGYKSGDGTFDKKL
jgi:hypothetical protein